jgi:hypothetical protein
MASCLIDNECVFDDNDEDNKLPSHIDESNEEYSETKGIDVTENLK